MARTFIQLIEEAKNFNYMEPNKLKKYWDNDDYFFKAISILINEPDLLKATEIICSWFPPLVMLFKGTLKRYMVYCTAMNQNIQTK